MSGVDGARGDLERVSAQYQLVATDFRAIANAAAVAEATHKRARARKIVELRTRGEARSIAEAEAMAEADDTIADLYQARLVAAAEAEAFREKLRELREQQYNARALMKTEQAIDDMHGYGITGIAS